MDNNQHIYTGDEVKAAMTAADIKVVDHHPCGLCGFMTRYIRSDEYLFFDSGCYCTYLAGGAEQRDWQDAADWINMQSKPENREHLEIAFGLLASEVR